MKLTINWGEIKTINGGKRLFEGSFKGEDGKEFNATIWELDRDGKQFPGFTNLRPGVTFEGNPWNSPTNGKCSIYPPKPVSEGSRGGFGASRGSSVAKAMDRKEKSIENFQETKEVSIKLAGAMRDAVLITTARGIPDKNREEIKDEILYWRNWLLENHGTVQDVIDPTK